MSMMSTDRRTMLRLALALCWIATAFGPGRTAIASEPTTAVEQLHAGLMSIMKAGSAAPFRQRYETIAPVIGRVFDLEVILQHVIGPRWASLPPDQQGALGDAFRRYTIASYVANFDGYSGQRFDILPGLRAAGGDRIVETRIVPRFGQPHELDYVLRQESGGWKIVDVLAEGSVSRVAAQRSEMRSVLSDGGGAALLVSLRRKTAELSGGILQ
jgi:phospholipid transport system substrate-binding protein